MNWHLYRHKNGQELKTNGGIIKHIELMLKGFKRMGIIDYKEVNKNVK